MQIFSGYCVGCLWGGQVHGESVARTKAPGKRHNSSGRSDFMPDFNYQYAPSTADDRQPATGDRHPEPNQFRTGQEPNEATKPEEPTRPTIEQWAQIISYAKRVVDDWTAAAASQTRIKSG